MLDIATTPSPSADLHTLTGSSASGTVPRFAPVATAPGTNPSSPSLSTRRPDPDAEVIDLAERVQRLNAREARLWRRTAAIEDAVDGAMPPRPERGRPALRTMVEDVIREDGSRVVSIVEPAGWREECDAIEANHQVALADWERRREAEGVRLGLPGWVKVRDRTSARLARWGMRLAGLGPVTQAGVAAKATTSRDVSGKGDLICPWRRALAASVGRDALRFLGAACDANEREHEAHDSKLFDLLQRYQRARQRYVEASDAEDAAAEAALTKAGDAIEAFAPRSAAGLAGKAAWILDLDPEEERTTVGKFLRQVATCQDHLGLAKPSAPGAYSSFPAWHAEVVSIQKGLNSGLTQEEDDRLFARWKTLDDLALANWPTSLAEAVGALDYARREHHQFDIESIDDSPGDVDMTDRIVQHCLDGALAVLRPMAAASAPEASNLRPVPLPTGIPAGRYPAGASRDMIETYRTFLEFELRYLNHEIYGRADGPMPIWLDNPAGSFHGSGEPPASSRAPAVLGVLGLMPEIDGAPLPAASAA